MVPEGLRQFAEARAAEMKASAAARAEIEEAHRTDRQRKRSWPDGDARDRVLRRRERVNWCDADAGAQP